MRFNGTLASWNDERGFGFIEPSPSGEAIFVHIKAFPAGTGRPTVGLRLTFELEPGAPGKKRACAVQFAPTRPLHRPPQRRQQRVDAPAPWTLPRMLAIPVLIALISYLATHWEVKPITYWIYPVASVLTLFAYTFDKLAAEAGRWRTSESTLHVLGLAGGWPGALVAQQLLRHKTAKAEFISNFWATVALNLAGLVALTLL
ncbi:DUF1294 domain-containing protein [Ideonella sp.]|uniref:DUF1294 domain-containing protein n=1 Tax=Ideonella sp. TaxID=1929293 RepID=UPI003BB4AF41